MPGIDYQAWVGKTERRIDVVTPVPLAAMAATLDRDDAPSDRSEPIPPLRHWLYFLPLAKRSEVGPDGHAMRGGFLPPVDLPRRMWAGGRFEFHEPLRIGDPIERVSRIVRVDQKQGRTGRLVFVLVRHEISTRGVKAITEEHDIVYRDHPGPEDPPAVKRPAPTDVTFERTFVPDEVLLFRYSALTFNGHRIHYDRRYVTDVEGYPGLVVHGPLIATLLVDLARDHLAKGRHDMPQGDHQAGNLPVDTHPRVDPSASGYDASTIAAFSFRAVAPIFDTQTFKLCGRPEAEGKGLRLWARDADGNLAMEAMAVLR